MASKGTKEKVNVSVDFLRMTIERMKKNVMRLEEQLEQARNTPEAKSKEDLLEALETPLRNIQLYLGGESIDDSTLKYAAHRAIEDIKLAISKAQ